jgi:hypothetical protein
LRFERCKALLFRELYHGARSAEKCHGTHFSGNALHQEDAMKTIREQIWDVVKEAKTVHTDEREQTLRSVHLIGWLDSMNAPVNLNLKPEAFADAIGLSYSVYLKRAQAYRVIKRCPAFETMLRDCQTEVSTLGLVAPKLTDANEAVILEGIRGKSRREAQAFLSRVRCDGTLKDEEGRIDVTLTFTESEWQEVERAREVLSARGKVPRNAEVMLAAVREMLKHKDPVQKAERAQARAEKKGVDIVEAAAQVEKPALNAKGERTAVPAIIKHARNLTDRGQCTWIYDDGSRCSSRLCPELEHIKAVGRGGMHAFKSTTTHCMSHNRQAAEEEYGRELMMSFARRPGPSFAGEPVGPS